MHKIVAVALLVTGTSMTKTYINGNTQKVHSKN